MHWGLMGTLRKLRMYGVDYSPVRVVGCFISGRPPVYVRVWQRQFWQ